MNNKGFAITTILYGVLILFLFLLVSMLGILSSHKNNLEKLIESNNGARDIILSGSCSSGYVSMNNTLGKICVVDANKEGWSTCKSGYGTLGDTDSGLRCYTTLSE